MIGMTGEVASNPRERLRIAVVHSFYSSRQPSGENAVVEQQVAGLRAVGHEVELIAQYTDQRERSRSNGIRATVTVASGHGPHPLERLRRFQPDVVHVHNLFPNFGRTWVDKWPGPIVATMHNFRPLCAAGTFFRDGHVCTDCLTRETAWPAVLHACYRNSRLKTLPLAVSTRFARDPLLERANCVVVLNEVQRHLYAQAGVDLGRLRVVPNFLRGMSQPGAGGGPWLFVGRLTPEKGILELLELWPRDKPLLIVGDGPLMGKVRALAAGTVEVLGAQPPDRVRDLLRQARGLVFPSLWFEGFPMVYLEALAAGTPVLAWEPSSVAAMVRRHGTGLVVGNVISDLEEAERRFPGLRSHARAVFEDEFTEASWLDAMTSLYREVVAGSRS